MKLPFPIPAGLVSRVIGALVTVGGSYGIYEATSGSDSSKVITKVEDKGEPKISKKEEIKSVEKKNPIPPKPKVEVPPKTNLDIWAAKKENRACLNKSTLVVWSSTGPIKMNSSLSFSRILNQIWNNGYPEILKNLSDWFDRNKNTPSYYCGGNEVLQVDYSQNGQD